MTIRMVYQPVMVDGVLTPQQPNFPATDQHPDAVRYLVGLYYVDAIGGEPMQQDIDALLAPPPASLGTASLITLLVKQGVITQAQVDAAVAAAN